MSGIGVITEYVVYKILNDCIKCNTSSIFHATYDLISEKYGTVNVKSSKLYNSNKWQFHKPKNQTIPNNYVLIGFNNDKTEILKVFIIPGDSNLIYDFGVVISFYNLERFIEYEVDSTIYNEVYQNLDIYSLPEFINTNIVEYYN